MGALELWHPRGVAADPADVVVVTVEARASGDELARELAAAAERLAGDGVLWVIAPRRRRLRAERAVRRSGLELRERVLPLPPWPATEHLMPLASAPLRDAVVRHLDMGPLRRRAVSGLVRTAAGRLALASLAPQCALVATHSRRVPVHGWLAELAPAADSVTGAVACSSRQEARVATVLRFPAGHAEPDLAVKRGLDDAGDERVRRERAALALLREAAADAGFAVPLVLPASDDATLVTPALPGRSAAWLLAHRRLGLERLAPDLADRLLAFAQSTAQTTPATQPLLDTLLVDRAARAGESIPDAGPYLETLGRLAERLEGAELVMHAAHSDLTMSNVLVSGEALALIDWESATPRGLPLGDLWYAVADALARSRRISHARAVELLATGDASVPAIVRELPERHARALGLSADQALLAFHACWLQHAADELDRGVRGPFLDVVEKVTLARLHWPR